MVFVEHEVLFHSFRAYARVFVQMFAEAQVPAELKQPRPGDPKNPSKASVMPPMFPPWARFDPRIRSATGGLLQPLRQFLRGNNSFFCSVTTLRGVGYDRVRVLSAHDFCSATFVDIDRLMVVVLTL